MEQSEEEENRHRRKGEGREGKNKGWERRNEGEREGRRKKEGRKEMEGRGQTRGKKGKEEGTKGGSFQSLIFIKH